MNSSFQSYWGYTWYSSNSQLDDSFTSKFDELDPTAWNHSRRALDKERLCQPWAIIQIADTYADQPDADVDDFIPYPAYIASYLRQYPKSADTYCIAPEWPFFFQLEYTKTSSPLYNDTTIIYVYWGEERWTGKETRIVFSGDEKRFNKQPLMFNHLMIQNVTHQFQCRNLLVH